MQISGPISSSLYKRGDRHFLLLGDMHFSKQGDCSKSSSGSVDVTVWLHKIMESSTKEHVVDVYLESQERSPTFIEKFTQQLGMTASPGHIHDVINYFSSKQCLSKIKTRCAKLYPGARVHYVDPRSKPTSDLMQFMQHLKPLLFTSNEVPQAQLETVPESAEFKKIVRWLKARPTANDVLTSLRANFGQLKITKQLDNMLPSDRKQIMEWFKLETKTLESSVTGLSFDHYSKLMRDAAAEKPFTSRAYVELLTSAPYLFSFVLEATLLEMDMYALGRMFRSFKDGSRPERVVVYAGDHHIRNYESCMIHMGAKCVERGKQTYMRCSKIGAKTTGVFGGGVSTPP
jgi:hypothetical protein